LKAGYVKSLRCW